MADEPSKKRLDQIIEINKQGSLYVDILKQQKDAFKQLVDEGEERLQGETQYNNIQKDNVSLANQLSTLSIKDLKTANQRNKLERKIDDVKKSQASLEKEISDLVSKNTDQSLKQAKIYKDTLDTSKDLVKEARKLEKTYRGLDNVARMFDSMSDFVKDIPVINKLFPEFKNAAEAARDAFAEGDNFFISFLKGLNELSTFALKGVIAMAVSGAASMQDRIVGISRSLGVSTAEASKMEANVRSTGMGFQDTLQSTLAFQDALGTSANIDRKSVV